MRLWSSVALLLVGGTRQAGAEELDEPGAWSALEDPGLGSLRLRQTGEPAPSGPPFRLGLEFGLSSLVVDPEVSEGIGGGLNLAWGVHRRLGVELSGFFSKNTYTDSLGSYGASFLAGNVCLGPTVQLTRPGSSFTISADAGLGAYVAYAMYSLREGTWSLGLYGGLSLGYKLTRWMGVGIKLRYHLFNLARMAGPDLKDIKALMTVGVIDRLELPGYVAFYF